MARDVRSGTPIASLAAGLLRGEELEAWALFEAAWPILERFVRVRLVTGGLHKNLLADCGQEVFTRVWRFRTSYHGTTEGEFWSWLSRICDNERRRILGLKAGRATISLAEDCSEDPSRSSMTMLDEAVDAAVLNEELAGLRECLRGLDGRHRRVIELAYFDPILPERPIAELLDCSPSNVHKLKVESLRLLEACLARKGIR